MDLPSEAGAAVETDLMLSALAPQSRDLVAREPLEPRGGVTHADGDRGPHATVAGRSAKTRVAGVPVLDADPLPSPLSPPGPSQNKRVAAFMASVGLSFVVGLPLVLRIDGVWGGGRPGAPIASVPLAANATAAVPTPVTPSTVATVATQATAVNAVVAQPLEPAHAALPGKGQKPALSAKTASVPATASPPPQAPAALNTAASPPPTPATQTPPPASTLQHGSLIQ